MATDIADLMINITLNEQRFNRQCNRSIDKLKKMGDSMKKVGGLMTKAFTLPVVAGLGYSIKAATDFEKAMSNVKANSDLVGNQFQQLSDLALKAGADTAFSAKEAAEGMSELVKAGLTTEQILEGGLMGSLRLASAGEIELADSAEIAATVLNAFKNDALDVGKAADILAGAANKSATSVQEMKYGLSMTSAVASGLGVSFMDVSTALAVFAQNGLKGSDAGTSLKTMLLNLSPSTESAAKMFDKLGLLTEKGTSKFYDAEGKLRNLSDIAEILRNSLRKLTPEAQQLAMKKMFGTDAIRAANILMKEGAKGVNFMANEIAKVSAADVASTKMNNFAGSIEELKGSVETLAIKIGMMLIPYIRKATDIVKDITNAFIDMPPEIQMAAVIIAILIAAIGPLLLVLSGLASGIGVIAGVISAFLTPVGLLVGVLAAVAIQTGLVKDAFNFAKEFIMAFADELTKAKDIGEAWNNTVEKLIPQEVLDGITDLKDKFFEIKDAIGDAIIKVGEIKDAIEDFLTSTNAEKIDILAQVFDKETADNIANTFLGMKQNVEGFLGVLDQIKDRFAGTFENMGEDFPGLVDSLTRLKDSFLELMDTLAPLLPVVHAIFGIQFAFAVGIIQGVLSGVIGIVSAFVDFLAILTDVADFVSNIFLGDFDGAMDALERWKDDVIKLWQDLWDGVSGIFTGFVEGFLGTLLDLYYQVVGGSIIPDMCDDILVCFNDMAKAGLEGIIKFKDDMITKFKSIDSKIGEIVGNATQWGSNMMGNLISGIESKTGPLRKRIAGISKLIHDFIGWESPTEKGEGRNSDKWIPNLIGMMEKGLYQGETKIRKGFDNLMPNIQSMNASEYRQSNFTQPTNYGYNYSQGKTETLNVNISGTIIIKGVSNRGEFIDSAELTSQELAKQIDQVASNISPRRIFQS